MTIPPNRGDKGGSFLPLFFTFSLFLSLSAASYSAEPLPAHQSDADLCTSLMSEAIAGLIADVPLPQKSIVELVYPHGIRLSKTVRTAMEACITNHGFLLAGSSCPADYTLYSTVTDVSVILLKKNTPAKGGERTVSITVHLLCKDADRSTVFAGGTTKTACDTIPENLLRQTDNGNLFSPEIERKVLGKSHTGVMVVSLVLISGVLIYFSSY